MLDGLYSGYNVYVYVFIIIKQGYHEERGRLRLRSLYTTVGL